MAGFHAVAVSHLGVDTYQDVYEPSEDTFLLESALEHDLPFLSQYSSPICIEIGPGTGYLIAKLGLLLEKKGFFLGLDRNPIAARTTNQTLTYNKVTPSDCIVGDLFHNLSSAWQNQIDIIVFNPPYVPTEKDEFVNAKGLALAWAGGLDGREVIDSFLADLDRWLSPSGCCYLLLLKENKPSEIAADLRARCFSVAVLQKVSAGRERLYVIRIQRELEAG